MIFRRPLIAIDIGSSAIKLLEVAGPHLNIVRAIGAEKLPQGAVHDGMLQDPPTVRAALKRLIKRLGVSTFGRRVSLGLSGSSVLIKKITVLRKEDVEFEDQIFFEAEQHFQHNLADLHYNHHVLTPNPEGQSKISVVIVGAKMELVDQFISLIRSVGMRTGVVDCATFAAGNMFEFNYGMVRGFSALVNIGANIMQVSLYINGEYFYTREVTTGGEEYSRRIMDTLGMSHDDAENLKVAVSLGLVPIDEKIQAAFSESSETLVGEIQTTVDYFLQTGEAAPGLKKVNNVFLTGGGACSLGLNTSIAASMRLPVHVVNPFRRFDVGGNKEKALYIASQGHMFSVATGLALRKMYDDAA